MLGINTLGGLNPKKFLFFKQHFGCQYVGVLAAFIVGEGSWGFKQIWKMTLDPLDLFSYPSGDGWQGATRPW